MSSYDLALLLCIELKLQFSSIVTFEYKMYQQPYGGNNSPLFYIQ